MICYSIRTLAASLMFPAVLFSIACSATSAEPTRDEALQAIRRATAFFRNHCSAGGGYVFRISEDLSLREGENRVGNSTAWIEPPGTPAVGMAYLRAYQLTRDPSLLEAARETAGALLQGQLISGGWTEQIEFRTEDRQQYAYRVHGQSIDGRRNTTTFDDNKTQSSVRFLMRLDIELNQSDAQLHEAVVYALEHTLAAQYRNGAWPQKYEGSAQDDSVPELRASYPPTWPREFPNEKYTNYYTLNDGTLCDLIDTLLEAGQTYSDKRYHEAAQRGGEFLLRAQMPEPQPGWAQQYNHQMHPAWARKFEPPAITGGESQRVMHTLLELYQRTADARYSQAVARALPYYQQSVRSDGRLARFYELQSNRPLYFTKAYELTYSDSDMPTHYGFVVSSGLKQIERELNKLRDMPASQLGQQLDQQTKKSEQPKLTAALQELTAQAIAGLDERGAWVEPGTLRTHPEAGVARVISSATFIKNLETLAQFVNTNAQR